MRTTTSIDWFAGTGEPISFPVNFSKQAIKGAPQRGYREAIRFVPDGRVLSSNRQRDDMPDHVRYSGKTLTSLAALMSAQNIVYAHTHPISPATFRCTRIDLALDVYDSGLNIENLYNLFQSGHVVTRARSASIISNTDGGQTIYIGSRTSDMFVRIYNKAAEMQLERDWIRIEVEIKGQRANPTATQCAETDALSDFIVGLIAGYLMFDDAVYRRALDDGRNAVVVPSQRKETDTRAWLLNQVVSAVVKVYNEGDNNIIGDMLKEIWKRVDN